MCICMQTKRVGFAYVSCFLFLVKQVYLYIHISFTFSVPYDFFLHFFCMFYIFYFLIGVKANSKGTLRLVLLSSSNLPKGKGLWAGQPSLSMILAFFLSHLFLLHVFTGIKYTSPTAGPMLIANICCKVPCTPTVKPPLDLKSKRRPSLQVPLIHYCLLRFAFQDVTHTGMQVCSSW